MTIISTIRQHQSVFYTDVRSSLYLDSQLAAVLYSCNRDGSAAVNLRDVSIHYWFAQLTTPLVLPSEYININMATVCKK